MWCVYAGIYWIMLWKSYFSKCSNRSTHIPPHPWQRGATLKSVSNLYITCLHFKSSFGLRWYPKLNIYVYDSISSFVPKWMAAKTCIQFIKYLKCSTITLILLFMKLSIYRSLYGLLYPYRSFSTYIFWWSYHFIFYRHRIWFIDRNFRIYIVVFRL